MRTDLLLVNNIRTLLQTRGQDQRALASWVGHHETWLSKVMREDRGVRLKDLDRIADFFGISVHQLLAPGVSPVTERRRGQRRSSRERRSSLDRRQGTPVAASYTTTPPSRKR